jgi:hypothetical protein
MTALKLLVLLFTLACSQQLHASHFRYSHVNWVPTGVSGEVLFKEPLIHFP